MCRMFGALHLPAELIYSRWFWHPRPACKDHFILGVSEFLKTITVYNHVSILKCLKFQLVRNISPTSALSYSHPRLAVTKEASGRRPLRVVLTRSRSEKLGLLKVEKGTGCSPGVCQWGTLLSVRLWGLGPSRCKPPPLSSSLDQRFSTGPDFVPPPPPPTLREIWQCPETPLVVTAGTVLLAYSGHGPGMLLNSHNKELSNPKR